MLCSKSLPMTLATHSDARRHSYLPHNPTLWARSSEHCVKKKDDSPALHPSNHKLPAREKKGSASGIFQSNGDGCKASPVVRWTRKKHGQQGQIDGHLAALQYGCGDHVVHCSLRNVFFLIIMDWCFLQWLNAFWKDAKHVLCLLFQIHVCWCTFETFL